MALLQHTFVRFSASLDAAMGKPVAVLVGTDPDVLKRGNGDANGATFESVKYIGAE